MRHIRDFLIALVLVIIVAVVMMIANVANGKVSEPILPIAQNSLVPVYIPYTFTSMPPITLLKPTASPTPIPTPKKAIKVIYKKVITPSLHFGKASGSIYGKASWYCKAGVSICHHRYPPGSMVAAACYKLRAAMGTTWRGKIVKVTYHSRSVIVKLVDWCGSRDKLIDLYWEPMRKLGGSGVLPVKVSW